MDSYQQATLDHPRLWALWQQMGVGPSAQIASMMTFENVVRRYQEPHRFYHTLAHLEALADHFDRHAAAFGDDKPAIIAALFFHDIVYQGKPGEDEAQSAKMALTALNNLGLGHRIAQRAHDIIVMTAQHAAPKGDHAAQLFLDMDMSILGSDPKTYERYCAHVRQEYSQYTDAQFYAGRAHFLTQTLQQGVHIFKTKEFADYNERAANNMRLELAHIQARQSAPAQKPQ